MWEWPSHLEPLELLLSLRGGGGGGGSGRVGVALHHLGAVRLNGGAVVVGAAVHGGGRGVAVASRALRHSGNLREGRGQSSKASSHTSTPAANQNRTGCQHYGVTLC